MQSRKEKQRKERKREANNLWIKVWNEIALRDDVKLDHPFASFVGEAEGFCIQWGKFRWNFSSESIILYFFLLYKCCFSIRGMKNVRNSGDRRAFLAMDNFYGVYGPAPHKFLSTSDYGYLSPRVFIYFTVHLASAWWCSLRRSADERA